MTSHEPISQSLPTFEEIEQNPDLLLDPSTIQVVMTNKEELVPGGAEAITPRIEADLAVAKDMTVDRVIGPEMGVLAIRKRAVESDQALEKGLTSVSKAIGEASDQVHGAGSKAGAYAHRAEDALRLISTLKNGVISEHGVDADRARAVQPTLISLAEAYESVKAGLTSDMFESAKLVHHSRFTAEDTVDATRKFVTIAWDEVLDGRRGFGQDATRTLDAIASRGAPTLNAHEQACAGETETGIMHLENNIMNAKYVVDELREVSDEVRKLQFKLDTETPHPTHLSGEVENLFQYIHQTVTQGPQFASLAAQSLQRLERLVQQSKEGIGSVGSMTPELVKTLEETRIAVTPSVKR